MHACCLFILITAGCTYPSGDSIELNFYGSVNESDSTFRVDGELALEGGIPDKDVYTNVRVFLYRKDGTEICSKPLGNLNVSEGVLDVSVGSQLKPHFVVFDSADFWSEPSAVEYLTYDETANEYIHGEATDEDELPVRVAREDPAPCDT